MWKLKKSIWPKKLKSLHTKAKNLILNVSKANFMIMYAVWVRARKNRPGLGNKRLSIRVPSFEKEKVEKLAKNTQKAVFITIL